MYNYSNSPYGSPYSGFNGNQYNNYMQNAQNGLQGQPKSLIRVNGIDGAKAYQVMPRETVALFDGNDDIFYVKSTDDGGFPTIKAYRFSEIDLTGAKPTNDYVTKSEFEELKKEVQNYAEQFVSKSKPTKKSVADDSGV